jgi:alanine racemase
VAFAITNIETLRSLAKSLGDVGNPSAGFISSTLKTSRKLKNKKITLQIKVDTGMHRQGILPEEIDEVISIARKNRAIEIEGVFTHFSDADNPNHAFTEKQIGGWNIISRRFKMEFPDIKYLHASASDGHRFSNKIDANVSRLGLGLYGLSDDVEFSRKMNLQPVLSMKTIITGLKPLKAGETTGYGNSFTAWKDTTIATIPVGYFEGLNRKLSNNGSVIVVAGPSGKNHIVCPIVGRVSMNITTIEMPAGVNTSGIAIGTPVIAISNNQSDQNSLASIAKKAGTITYEIAVHIPAHLKRVVV